MAETTSSVSWSLFSLSSSLLSRSFLSSSPSSLSATSHPSSLSQSSSDHGELNWPSPNETMRPDQLNTVIILERVGASASLVGVLAIFVTYAAFKRLRTLPNLFIAMASLANVGASVACLIGRDGVALGEDSALCQAQAFMLEMLMQSDPWWSLAMAINVFLVFFHGASTVTFRQYLWIYAVVCYGVPFIPALALLFVRDEERGPVYGDATLWCWIEPRWNALRIYTYYLPIWVCIFFSAIVYGAVGTHVFRRRNQLQDVGWSDVAKNHSQTPKGSAHPGDHQHDKHHGAHSHNLGGQQADPWSSQQRDSAEKIPTRQDYYGTAVTEVQVVSHNQTYTPPISPHSPTPRPDDVYSGSHTPHFRPYSIQQPPKKPLPAVHRPIRSSMPMDQLPDLERLATASVDKDEDDAILRKISSRPSLRAPRPTSPPLTDTCRLATLFHESSQAAVSRDSTKLSATSVSASSTSHPSPPRTYPLGSSQQHPSFLTTVTSTKQPQQPSMLSRIPLWSPVATFFNTFKVKYERVDTVKKAYLRTSAIFALSVLFTWTPSSINRVYSLLHPETVSYGLNVASAFVLPLQGVWNAVIYFSTSWRPLCEEIDALKAKRLRAMNSTNLPWWKGSGSAGDASVVAGFGGSAARVGSHRRDYPDVDSETAGRYGWPGGSPFGAGSKFGDRGMYRSRSEEDIDFDRITMPPSGSTARGEVRAIRGSF